MCFGGKGGPYISRVAKKKNKSLIGVGAKKHWAAHLTMALPGVVFLLLFSYLPMPGIIQAFKNYLMRVPPEESILQNTFLYSLFTSEWNG